jgi:molecular chaperone GrpE (heat shock protein)
MNKVVEIVNKLNGRLLQRLEGEIDVLKEAYPELQTEFDGVFKRLRKGTLDEVNNCKRQIINDETDSS